jgi:lipopolysaccharide cholinephosphotransferase
MKLQLKTENGIYRYKFIPIYQGIKRIDKSIAQENLEILKDVCDNANLRFILFYGTLLGAVREHDFITHDEDIDVLMYKSDMKKFLTLLFTLRDRGFELARYESRGFLSIIRKGEYIDVYFYEEYTKDANLWYCCQDVCKKEFVFDLIPYNFLEKEYYIPRNYIQYLEYYFGLNWQTPIQIFDYNKSRISIIKEYTIQYIKALLPEKIVTKFQEKGDKKRLTIWINKIYHK